MESNTIADVLAEYEKSLAIYDNFRGTCEKLLARLIEVDGLRVHSVTSRVKDRDSLNEKLGRAGKDYHSVSEVTDLVGIRVITYFEDEVDRVGNIVEKEFRVDPRSIDKRKILDPDRFGYLSLHYICALSADRTNLSENQLYRGLVCERQIRSILQHAWAEIEHDLGYGATIPSPIRRRFSRLAGLLEVADQEFIQIRGELAAYTTRVGQEILADPSSVSVDKISVDTFIDCDEVVRRIDKEMADHVGAKLYKTSDTSALVEQLRYVGFETIRDVKLALESRQAVIIDQWKRRMAARSRTRDQVMKGISLFHLFQLVVAEKGPANLRAALDKFEIGSPERRDEISDSIIAAVRKS
jgi:putative GTP pyrophosphokinase